MNKWIFIAILIGILITMSFIGSIQARPKHNGIFVIDERQIELLEEIVDKLESIEDKVNSIENNTRI